MMRSVLVAAVLSAVGSVASAEQAAMLLYQEIEPGIEPYPSRILVTDGYLRMDDGTAQGNFVLFDRERLRIHSVNHEDRTVFEIPARPVELKSPIPLERRHQRVEPESAPPKVGGRQPEYYRLYVNDKRCYDVVAVPDLLKPAVAALKEFRQVLAGEHARVLPAVPADLHEPCDLALNTFAPTWPLAFGLPIQARVLDGRGRVLVDFRERFEVAQALFELPEGYQVYGAGDVPALGGE